MPLLVPPAENSGIWGTTGLLRFKTFPVGTAIVKRNGAWGLEPSVMSLEGAEEYFLGGYKHIISDAKAEELRNAGFGAYINAITGGYGAGLYGDGPYGG